MTKDGWEAALAEFIRGESGADRVRVTGGERLVGGAIQVNRAVTAEIEGGPLAGSHELVLRLEAVATVPESRPLAQQFAFLKAAHAIGVTVPEPLWYCGDAEVIGAPFYAMRRVSGIALGSRVVKLGPHPEIAVRLAGELAKIHTIVPPRADLDFLDLPRLSPAVDSIERYRGHLDREPEPHPALEWGLRWLERHAPPAGEIVLAHHDFRTGNYAIDNGELTGILDWEFAGWSEPMEDVAWICAKCWRFGGVELEAGGIAPRDLFYDAYEAASGRRIDREVVHFWEVMAHVRWAVIALHQTARHRFGGEPDLDLALVGRRLPELEHEVLHLTGVL